MSRKEKQEQVPLTGQVMGPVSPLLSHSLTCLCVGGQLHLSAPFSVILQGSLPLNGLLASLDMLMLFPEHMLVFWSADRLPHLTPTLLQSRCFWAALLALPDKTFLFFL